MKNLILHKYITGTKPDMLKYLKVLQGYKTFTDFTHVDDLNDRDFDNDKKLYLEIKVVEY